MDKFLDWVALIIVSIVFLSAGGTLLFGVCAGLYQLWVADSLGLYLIIGSIFIIGSFVWAVARLEK